VTVRKTLCCVGAGPRPSAHWNGTRGGSWGTWAAAWTEMPAHIRVGCGRRRVVSVDTVSPMPAPGNDALARRGLSLAAVLLAGYNDSIKPGKALGLRD